MSATAGRVENLPPAPAADSVAPRIFDLRTQADTVRRWNLLPMVGRVAAGSAGAIAGLVVLFHQPTILDSVPATVAIGLFLTVVGILAIVDSLRFRNGGVRRLTVDEGGIILEYSEFPNGRRVTLPWNRLSQRIILQDCRAPASRDYLAKRTGILWVSPRPVSDLTPEAMDAIVGQASKAGLSVKESMNSQGVTVVEITPAAIPGP
jgi:hypothetical protein